MFNYDTLSPSRKLFVDAAREIFPDLGDTISRSQVNQVVEDKKINLPQWLIVRENQVARGVYSFPNTKEDVVVNITETDSEIELRIADRYESMETLVKAVAANTVNSLIVAGAPGLGKSYTVNKVLGENNSGFNYVFHKGYIRASHLFRLLWENRLPGQTIVLDDTDSVFGDENALNLLKAALELKPVRRIGWGSEKEFIDEDGEVIPRYFDFSGSVIFLTNLPVREMVESGSKLSPHLAALESRSLVLDLGIKTKREYMIKIKQTVRAGMLRSRGLNESQEKEVVDFMEENVTKLMELSLRMAEKLAALYLMDPTKWKKLAEAVCFKK